MRFTKKVHVSFNSEETCNYLRHANQTTQLTVHTSEWPRMIHCPHRLSVVLSSVARLVLGVLYGRTDGRKGKTNCKAVVVSCNGVRLFPAVLKHIRKRSSPQWKLLRMVVRKYLACECVYRLAEIKRVTSPQHLGLEKESVRICRNTVLDLFLIDVVHILLQW